MSRDKVASLAQPLRKETKTFRAIERGYRQGERFYSQINSVYTLYPAAVILFGLA